MSPTESYIRNLFAIQRLGNGIMADVEATLQDLFDDLVGQIAKVDPTAVKAASYRMARVQKLVEWVREHADATYVELAKEVRTALAEVGVQQAKWQAAHIVGTIEYGGGTVAAALKPGLITLNQWKAIIDTDFVQGRTMREWFASQNTGTVERIQAQIRIGASRGESIDELTQRIRGTRKSWKDVKLKSGESRRVYSFEGGVLPISTRNAQSIVRTAVNEISNTAHFSVYEANADLVTGYRYLATLDSDTTLLCRSLHGQTWALDDPDGKRPPQHWGCRSTTQPVIKGLEDIYDQGMVATEGGPMKGSTTQEQWLRMQPREKLDGILGKRRADLFRAGKVDLRDMVRSDGSIVRVADLEGVGGVSGGVPLAPVRAPRFGSVGEAEKWATDNLSVPVEGLSGTNLEYASEVLGTMKEIEGRVKYSPLAEATIRFGGLKGSEYAAFSPGTETLHFRKKVVPQEVARRFAQDNEVFMKRVGTDVPFHSTDDVRGLVWHEVGHAIDHKFEKSYSAFIANRPTIDKVEIGKISGYAFDDMFASVDAASEAWAEAFAAVATGSSRAQFVPPWLVEIIEQTLRKGKP